MVDSECSTDIYKSLRITIKTITKKSKTNKIRS